MEDKNDLLCEQEFSQEPQKHELQEVTENSSKLVDMGASIETYAGQAIKNVQRKMSETGSNEDFREGSKNIAHMVATADALDSSNYENEEFLKQIKHEKQEELKESFKGERYKEQAKTLESKRKKAEEFYNNFRPILEFDFSPLIPKNSKTVLFRKRVKRDKKGNVINNTADQVPQQGVVDNNEYHRPTYEDRSYGIPLMCLMLALLIAPYCFVTILLAVFNGVNAVFDGIARFGKPALLICGSIVGIAIMILFVYCVILGIDNLFGTTIISSLGVR